MTYNEELLRLSPIIDAIAEPFRAEVEAMRWISTPNGDEGSEWCYDCGKAKVEELRAADPEHSDDYFLDGGWAIEDDCTCWCERCGVRLKSIMTDYCAGQELSHYVNNGIVSFCEEIAYDIAELVNHYEYEHDKTDPRDTADVIRLARSFIAGHHHQDVTQPGQWADDGGRA
ncbi:hypothetical protein N5C81_15020 [Rhizobium pusense]|uniref:hypothetical protein n=1 Tax=Agrobacterium pusense TaxID=648995 RepID=UPI0024475A73|nr:hypothetical protein [Agrobacterium pusense]MDH1268935.1 hypothetical protein [Agrobacterium pusense]